MSSEVHKQTAESWMKEAQKGYIRVAILILLNRKPSHGYEIMKEIKGKTQGYWKPTAGGVYPILRNLEKDKYIEGTWQSVNNRKLKSYKITPTGQQMLRQILIKQTEIANNMNILFEEFSRTILNVEPTVNLPAMHTPFSLFLEESTIEKDIASLEKQQKEVKNMIHSLQDKLKAINGRISEKKKEAYEKIEKEQQRA
jgi:DNA-binding PadR family transcriptional regulator